MRNSYKILKLFKKIWNFVFHHNAFVIALELAIFVGIVFAFAAPNDQESGIMNYELGNSNITVEQYSNKTTTSEQLIDTDQQQTADNEQIQQEQYDNITIEQYNNLEELKIKEIGSEKYAFKTLDGDVVEMGMEEHSPPQPYLKLNKWNGESWLKVSLPTSERKTISLNNNKVKWITENKEVHLYPIEPSIAYARDENDNPIEFQQNELGGAEFEIILKKKPKTNKVILNIETKGLEFYYQPPLHPDHPTWADEDGDGKADTFSPENVVGSYAVYHATKRDHILGQTNYKAGKAFHIYRPRIEDADGKWVWGELHIDEQLGTLTVTIPQDFLDTAVYPIRHAAGNTFGYTSIGATWMSLGDFFFYGSPFTGAAGTGISMSAYTTVPSGKVYRYGLYNHSTKAFVKGTNQGSTSGESWKTENFTDAPTLEAIEYSLFSWVNDTTYATRMYGDSTGWTRLYEEQPWASGWPNPITDVDSGTYRLSIYVTYTPEYQPRPPAVQPGGSGGFFMF